MKSQQLKQNNLDLWPLWSEQDFQMGWEEQNRLREKVERMKERDGSSRPLDKGRSGFGPSGLSLVHK